MDSVKTSSDSLLIIDYKNTPKYIIDFCYSEFCSVLAEVL